MLNGSSDNQGYLLPPRFMIAAPQGRSGKTTVSLGLCAAFRKRGLAVQPFKKGPDYIDPSWLSAAANKSCRNLDPFFMTEAQLSDSCHRASRSADLVIIEGAMGLYDGFSPDGKGSSAWLARLFRVPVILVINAARLTRSVAAMVAGYQNFEPGTCIAGVILNNVSGSRHESKLAAAVREYCGIPILGAIPRDPALLIPERHLGLTPFRERDGGASIIECIYERLNPHLDLDGILAVARKAPAMPPADIERVQEKCSIVRTGILFDRVFTFYYPENLEALQRAGAGLVFIDSLHDRRLPEIDALYIGGGFPELFMEELEANESLRHDIARAAEGGLPVYAECAGLMYLCRGIQWQGRRYEMAGVIAAEVEMCPQPQGHGYVEAEITAENPLFPAGTVLRGHEFHYSRLSGRDGLRFAYYIRRGHGVDGKVDAIVHKNVIASYTHLHALGTPQWAEAFVTLAVRARKGELSLLKT
jgi:cobyrinic acid a,c-diamide synthase